MMAMVLPIVISRLIHLSGAKREKLKYAICAAIIMAGIVATFRKSAFLAPISVCLTIAYFRRRELLKLAPLGIVLIVMVQALSPGALNGVLGQLNSSRLGVNTVSDRTADYDAIRPDVLQPPADRPRLRQLRAIDLPDPRHGAVAAADRGWGAGADRLPLDGGGGGVRGAQADPVTRPARRADRARRGRGRGVLHRGLDAVRRHVLPARAVHLPVDGGTARGDHDATAA